MVDNVLNLIMTHQNTQNCLVFLDLFLLFSDGVKHLFLLVFMLVANICQFLKIGYVLGLDFLEAEAHLVYFLVQRFIIFFNVEELFLSSLLLFDVLLLSFLLRF